MLPRLLRLFLDDDLHALADEQHLGATAHWRDSLTLRYGSQLSRHIDQALGEMSDPIKPLRPADLVEVRRPSAELIGTAEMIARYNSACEFVSTLLFFDHAAGEPLAALLPDVFHIPVTNYDAARMLSILKRVGTEKVQAALGGSYIVGRLLDVLFIQAIRISAVAVHSRSRDYRWARDGRCLLGRAPTRV